MAKSRHCGGGRIKIRPPMPPVDGQHSPVTFPGFASGFKITGHLGKREAGAASRPLKNHPAAPISKSRQIFNVSAIASTRPAHETRKPDMPTTGTSLNDLKTSKKITLASFFLSWPCIYFRHDCVSQTNAKNASHLHFFSLQ